MTISPSPLIEASTSFLHPGLAAVRHQQIVDDLMGNSLTAWTVRPLGGRLGRTTAEPSVVQQISTATSSTPSGSERLLPAADVPQRPRATSPPRVRIEVLRVSASTALP